MASQAESNPTQTITDSVDHTEGSFLNVENPYTNTAPG